MRNFSRRRVVPAASRSKHGNAAQRRMRSGERIVRLSDPAGESGEYLTMKNRNMVRTIRARWRSLLPANFFGRAARARESRGPAPHMGRVSFVQTIQDRQLFPVRPLTNHFAYSSHPRRELGIKCSFRRFLPMSGYDQGKGSDVLDAEDRARFEQLVLPHLDAAFNLARWLLRRRADSEDVAQEAMLRAYRFFRGFHGGDARAWLLQIVRNACYTWLEKNRPVELMTEFDEELHPQPSTSPEALAIAGDNRERLTRALETLPPRFREVLVLRTRRLFLQGDCRHHCHSDRHRHVCPCPRPPASPARAHARFSPG